MDQISGYRFAFEMDDGGFVRTAKEMRNEAKMLKSAMKSNFAEIASGGDKVKAYEQKLRDLSRVTKAEQMTVKEATAEQEKLDQTTTKGRAEFARLQGVIDRAKTSIAGYQAQTTKAEDSLKYYRSGLDKVNESIKLNADTSRAYITRLQAEGQQFKAQKVELSSLNSEYGQLETKYKKQEKLLADIASESGKTSNAYIKQKTKLDETGAAMARTKTDMTKLNETISKANPSIFSRMGRSLLGLNKNAEHTGSVFKSVFSGAFWGNVVSNTASSAFNVIKNGIGGVIKAGTDFNRQMQTMNATWTTLTGSADKGRAMVKMTVDMAAAAANSVDMVQDLNQKLYSVTNSAGKTQVLTKAILTLQDAFGQTDDAVKGFTTQFSQMQANGKVQAQDMMSFVNVFPKIRQELLKTEQQQTGNHKLTMAQLNDMMSAGKITAKTMDDVIVGMGKKYKSATANFGATTDGMMRTITGRIKPLFGDLTSPLMTMSNPIFGAVSKWVSDPRTDKEFAKIGNAASKGFSTISEAFAKAFNTKSLPTTMNSFMDNLAVSVTNVSKAIADHASDIINFFKGLWAGVKIIGAIGTGFFKGLIDGLKLILDPILKLTGHTNAVKTFSGSLEELSKHTKALETFGKVLAGLFVAGKVLKMVGAVKKYADFLGVTSKIKMPVFKPDIKGLTGNNLSELSGMGKAMAGAVGIGIAASDAMDISKALTTKNPRKKFESYGSAIGTTVGAGIGFYFGGPAGAAIGGQIGHLIGKWGGDAAKYFMSGWDAYNDKHPLDYKHLKGNVFQKSGYEFNKGFHGRDDGAAFYKDKGLAGYFTPEGLSNSAGLVSKNLNWLDKSFNPLRKIEDDLLSKNSGIIKFFQSLGNAISGFMDIVAHPIDKLKDFFHWLENIKLPQIKLPKFTMPKWLDPKNWHLPKISTPKIPEVKAPKLPGWLNWKEWHWPKMSGFKFPHIEWPKLTGWLKWPEFKWPKVSLFKIPTIHWPKLTGWISWKEFKWPHFSLPKLPKIKWPELPKWLKLSTFHWPKFEMPKFPKINWPKPPSWLSNLNPFGKKKSSNSDSKPIISDSELKNARDFAKLKFPKLPSWVSKKEIKLPQFKWSTITKGMSKELKSMDKSVIKTMKSITKEFKNATKVKWNVLSNGLSKQLKSISKTITKTTKSVNKSLKNMLKIKWTALTNGMAKVLKNIDKSVTKTARNMKKTLTNALKVRLNWANTIKSELNKMLKAERSFASSFNHSWKSHWSSDLSYLRSNFNKMVSAAKSWDTKMDHWFGGFSKSFEKAWKSLSNNLLSTWKSLWKQIDSLSDSGMHKAVGYINGGIRGIDYVLGRFGGSSSTISQIHFATGTGLLRDGRLTRDTMAVLNDGHDSPETGNRERIVHSDGSSEEVSGVNTQRYLKAGDAVLNASENKYWPEYGVPRFAEGTGIFNSKYFKGITGSLKNLLDVAKNVGGNISGSFADLFGPAPAIKGAVEQDFSQNVFDKNITKSGVPWWGEVWKLINEAINSGSPGELLKAVEKYGRGKPYVWAATGPDAFDCSGLVMYALKHAFNIDYPHFSGAQIAKAQSISRDQLKPGDLIGNDEHIGVYAGHGQYWSAMSPSNHPNIGMEPTSYFPGTPKYGRVKGIHGGSDDDYQDVGKNYGLEGFVKRELGRPMFQWIEKNLAPLADEDDGAGGSFSPSMIGKAAEIAGVNPSASFVKMLQQTIQSESGGRNIVQQIHDMNSGGNEARGILQFTPGTFRAFAKSGHTNIMNPMDQLIAFFNNSDWQNSIGHTNIWGTNKVDWLHSGPQGHRRFENGGIVRTNEMIEVAEKNMAESIIPWDIMKRSRANQLLKQTVNHFEKTDPNFDVKDLSDKKNDNDSFLEKKLDLLTSQLSELIQVVIDKPTGITNQQIHTANKSEERKSNKLKNFSHGQFGLNS